MKRYTIPAQETRTEIQVLNSRFIASAAPVFSVDEAKAFVARIRKEYADASHNVPAFVVGHGSTVVTHCHDDGEPSGTAGRPALAVLSGSGLGDAAVVVTRYFGGTKLGTGGLVRAYGDAVRAVLDVLPLAEKVATHVVMLATPYPLFEQVRLVVQAHHGQILDEDFTDEVTVTARFAVEHYAPFQARAPGDVQRDPGGRDRRDQRGHHHASFESLAPGRSVTCRSRNNPDQHPGAMPLKAISIFNDVLGPVMRGPSSSHTAASYHIGRLARALLGADVDTATFTFDPDGSYAQVYAQQGSDRAFAAGLMGWTITDDRFHHALDLAAARGIKLLFEVQPLHHADHPNTVEIRTESAAGRSLRLVADSIGGGAVVVTRLNGWPLRLTGDAHEVLVELEAGDAPAARDLLEPVAEQAKEDLLFLHARRAAALDPAARGELERLPGLRGLWTAPPIFFAQRGQPLLSSAAEMVALAEKDGITLGQVALAYESALLGIPEGAVLDEMQRRFEVMRAAVERGLGKDLPPMQLLRPTARSIFQSEAAGRLPTGGIHTRAAARAMAVMHVNGGHGVVCAAPTAGAAGVVPAVVVTLAEEWDLGQEQTNLALLAASAVGLVLGTRATFAAEVAGCQVEIGAAGAMAAAAVVEAAGGTAAQALDAAAISFQNTMGSVCDLVQGIVEIPCHTRNAVAASSAFLCADLILGGYVNPIPLDETIDAVYAVGQMLPRELRCTALGGLAVTPSALALPRLR